MTTPLQSDPELKGKVILVIDDNPANLKVIFDCLEMYGYEVLIARSGESGIQKAVYALPDLILLDIVMPEMNGFDTCRRLKSDDRTCKIPVIMITALADIDHKIEGFRHGAVDYITKPIRIEEVAARVATHLKLKTYNEGLEAAIHARTMELSQANRKLEKEIESRKKTENELRQLRNFLNNIVDSMPSMLVGIDSSGRVTHWNAAVEKATEISAADIKGRPLPEAFTDFLGGAADYFTTVQKKSVQTFQKVRTINDTEEKFSDITIYPLVTNGLEGAVIRVDDATERVRMEELMIQTEKMMTIGGLAAGMAHEINNPVAGIIQSAQVINNRISPNLKKNVITAGELGIPLDAVRSYLEKREITTMLEAILQSGRRVAQIVDNMLSFSRKSTAAFSRENIPDLIDKAVALARNDYNLKKNLDFQKVVIHRDYHPDTPDILCERLKIQQVVLNLLKNASQAMAEGPASVDPEITISIRPDGRYVTIDIKDNGPGIDPKISGRIFEPFFTTKKMGEGTGLGLSISYFIITENHKGNMSVKSGADGTCFTIQLPADGKSV